MSTVPPSSFWNRIGLQEEDGLRYVEAVRGRYPGCEVHEFQEQGYCSFTLLVSLPFNISTISTSDTHFSDNDTFAYGRDRSRIVQIRPLQHALDLSVVQAAKETYTSLAPAVRVVELELPGQLRVYEMQKISGTPLSRLLPQEQVLDSTLQKKQERLVASFAGIIAQGWHSASKSTTMSRNTRADSPMENVPDILSRCTGKVGSSIIRRLGRLGEDLPDVRLRQKAKNTLARVRTMNAYPVVLNHGDLIPSNILVDEDTWNITGLVDWAEAEDLPFGTCLYGLELMLGYITSVPRPSARPNVDSSVPGNVPQFVYFENAAHLRRTFWSRLFEIVPEINVKQEAVNMMRDLGVLLWYGYAWDDGAINRVVNEMDDVVELACLRTFLDIK
jgi:hypothetical protein